MSSKLTASTISDLDIKFHNDDPADESVLFDAIYLAVATSSKPSVNLTSPVDGSAITDTTPTFAWTMSDSDDPTSSLESTITVNGPTPFSDSVTGIPYSYANPLLEGHYTWSVSVTDGINTTNSETFDFWIDQTDPKTPTDVFVKRISSASIAWRASSDNEIGGSGVAGYKLYRNNVLIATIAGATTTSYFDATAPAGYLKYSLSAIDKAGNESGLAFLPLVPDVTIDGSTGIVKMTWTTHPGNSDGYSVWKNIGGVKTLVLKTNGNTYTDTTVKAGEIDTYAIRAHNLEGNSAESTYMSVLIPEPDFSAIGGGAGREISGAVSGAATTVAQGTTETQAQAGGEVQGAESNQNANVNQNANENANENANVNANENTNSQEEEAGAKETNWPLIVAIIIAALIVIGGGLYWWFSREEDEI